jgi:putative transcriptional regulator
MIISIKPLMDSQHITRYELAQKMGVTYPTINNIYKGNATSIRLDTLEGLCRELHCTPNDIIKGEY